MDQYAGNVRVRLSAHEMSSTDLDYPERRVTLTRENNILPIGRTSKVESKGLLAKTDNAWFDSPVMSRSHAVVVADLDQKRVHIRDTGSLHGTYLNNDKNRIPEEPGMDLREGDILRFGVPVFRGHDAFPPLSLRVGIEFHTQDDAWEGTSTYKAPDASDNSSDEDESDSDDDASLKENTLPSILAPTAPGDNTPRLQHLAQGPSDAAIKPESDLHRFSHMATIDLTEATNSPSILPALPGTLIDLTQVAEDSDSDSDSESDIELGQNSDRPIDLSSPPREMSPVEDAVISNGLAHGGNEDNSNADLPSSRESSADVEPRPQETSVSFGQNLNSIASLLEPQVPARIVTALNEAVVDSQAQKYVFDDEEEESIRLSDSKNDDSIESGSSVEDDVYNASTTGVYQDDQLSDDGSSDMSFESELEELQFEGDYPSEEDDDGYDDDSMVPIWDDSSESGDSEVSQAAVPAQTSSGALFPGSAQQQLPAISSFPCTQFSTQSHTFGLPPAVPQLDDGSSSVSAFEFRDCHSRSFAPNLPSALPLGRHMFAPAAPTHLVYPASIPIPRPTGPSDAAFPTSYGMPQGFPSTEDFLAAEKLGVKAGKPEFFAAREENKHIPKLYSEPIVASSPTYPTQPTAYQAPPTPTPMMPLAVSVPVDAPQPSLPSLTDAIRDVSKSPAPQSGGAEDVPKPSRRTHVGISDIVENCEPVSEKAKGKRKAEDISDLTPDDLHWEGADAVPETSRSPATSPSELATDTEATSVDTTMEETLSVPAEHKDSAGITRKPAAEETADRPSKRVCLRRVAERLGYVAIGGFTGAAFVVSSLIYTAPTFS